MALTSAFTPLRIALSRLPGSVMSASCSGPSGEVPQALISPPSRCASSSIDAPPMSQTSPSASGQPRSTPFAASRASSGPLATWSCRPVSRSTWSQNAGPSAASRTAAVATAIIPDSCIFPASAAKRCSAAIASVQPSRLSRPVSLRPTPRPQSTFSL